MIDITEAIKVDNGVKRLETNRKKVSHIQRNPVLRPSCYYGHFILAQKKAQ